MQCGQGPDEVPFDVSQELVKGASLLVELAVLAILDARGLPVARGGMRA